MLIMYLGHTRFKITQGRPSAANGSLEEAKRRWGKGLPEVGIEEVQSLVPGSQTEAEFSHKTSLLNWANIPKTAKPRQDMDKSGPKDKALQRNRKNKIHRRSKGRNSPNETPLLPVWWPCLPWGSVPTPCMAVPPTVTWKEASTALSAMSGSVCVFNLRGLLSLLTVSCCYHGLPSAAWWACAFLQIFHCCSFLFCQKWNWRCGACNVITHSSISPALTHNRIVKSMEWTIA